jgi:hypothetical protein
LVAATNEELASSPLLLGTLTVMVDPVEGSPGDWQFDPSDTVFEAGSAEAAALLNEADSFVSRVTLALRNGDAGVGAQYDFEIVDLTAVVEAAP